MIDNHLQPSNIEHIVGTGSAQALASLAIVLILLSACQSGGTTPTLQPAATTVRPATLAPAPSATSIPAPTVTATARPPSPTAPPTATATTELPTPTAAPPQPTESAAFDPRAFRLELAPFVSGLRRPVFVTHAGDGSGDLYVVEQAGTIRLVADGTLRSAPFLNITPIVGSSANEQGLLGLAFHPNYAANRQFFVNYTDLNGDTVIARYTAAPDGSAADPDSAQIILQLDQPYPNHNGGMLAFGPDGKLWIGTGDGGSAGDPRGNGQNRRTLLGKMLRIDVDAGDPYGIPPDNPFVNDASTLPEIWALGFRNPWRYSFDRATGDLFIGDVGQGTWEEIDLLPAGSRGGENYGWNIMEGGQCYERANCNRSGLELPIAAYPTHEDNTCAVTGGYVYRGQAYPVMSGGYFYADFCGGQIWALAPRPDGTWQNTRMLASGLSISSFGEDEIGELYITTFEGTVYQLTAAAP